jgi:hypothetical protein
MDNNTTLKNLIGQTVSIVTEYTYHDDVTITDVDTDNVYIDGYDSAGNSTDYIVPIRDIESVNND